MGEKKKKKAVQLSVDDFFAVSTFLHWQEDMPYFTLWISESVVVVNLFHLPRVTLVCEHVQDCVVNLMPADLLSSA